MKVKTYGINGLSEWHGDIKAGSISVKVSFVGGTASPSGAQPAYLVTKDPITQFVIENSKEFKSGFIHLEMSQEIPGNHRRMAIPSPIKPTEPPQQHASPTEPPKPTEPIQQHPNETEKDEAVVIKVADKKDAIEWLKEHYPEKGYNGSTLRGNAAFDAACTEHKVKFEYAE